MKFISSAQRIISTPTVTILVVLLALTGRALQVLYFADAGGDKAFQILATQSFLQGHGFSNLQVFAGDLSHSQYVPLIKWPPGYSVLLMPFYLVCGEIMNWGTILLDLVSALLLLWLCRQTLNLLHVPIWKKNLYTLIAGFFLYAFCQASTSDMQGALLYQTEIWCAIRFLQTDRKHWLPVFLIVLFAFTAGLTRYLLIPAGFAVPVYFILSGRLNRDADLFRKGIVMLVLLGLLNAAFLYLQQQVAGAATYVIPSERGFFPGNLYAIYAFILAAFTNLELVTIQLSHILGTSYGTTAWIMIALNGLLAGVLLYVTVNWLSRKRFLRPSHTDNFIYISLIKFAAVLAVLFYLSATYAPIHEQESQTWTFLQEGRYYFMAVLFLQQMLFVIPATDHPQKDPRWLQLMKKAGLVALFLFTLHGILFTVRKPVTGFYHGRQMETTRYLKNKLAQLMQETKDRTLLITGHEQLTMLFPGLWFDLPYLEDYTVVNNGRYKTTKPVTIVVCIRDKFTQLYTGFLANPQKQLIGQIHDYRFYTLAVNP